MARISLMLLPALCVVASAQTAPPAVPASVSGTVTNSVTGEPILRAHVQLRATGSGFEMNSQTYGALTNQEGKFTIAPLPEGGYVASVERIGFVAPPNRGRNGGITLAAGDKKEDVKLTLTPTGTIMGRVLDSAGEPAPEVTILAQGNGDNQNVTTDEQGRYRIGGLRPGKYRVLATPRRSPFGAEIRTDGTEEVHHSPTYYPDTLARGSARRLDLQPAVELGGIDIHLVRTALLSVSGTVTGMPGGNAHTSIQVMNEGEFGYGGPQASVKADGSFKISPIDPGKYTIVAVGSGQTQRTAQSGPLDIEVGSVNLEHLELRMIPPFDVQGQMRFDDEAARTAAQRTTPRQIRLQPFTGVMRGDVMSEIAADDSFTLERVAPGLYHVTQSWGPVYVRSVRVGDTETDGGILDLRNGPGGPVSITVSSLTCQISGTVNDSSGPAAGAFVMLVPEADKAAFARSTAARPDGTYTFTGLPPGKYKLASADEGVYNNPRSDHALEDYEDVVESVELRAGDKVTKNLKRK